MSRMMMMRMRMLMVKIKRMRTVLKVKLLLAMRYFALYRVTTGPGKSWNLGRPYSGPG